MEDSLEFAPRDGRRPNGPEPTSMDTDADTPKGMDIDDLVRAAYKKHGRCKLVQKAVEVSLRK